MHYESLPPDDRAKMAAAASQFLLQNDYVSLFEAAEMRDMAAQELWNEIMADAGLPACDLPVDSPPGRAHNAATSKRVHTPQGS